MKTTLISKLKLALLVVIGIVIGIVISEILARKFAPKDSVFWNNPMMMPYAGGAFDPNTTLERLHENNDPNRVQKYVPDADRWYRLDPEPEIPPSGKLVLNFGDSSTWEVGGASGRGR